MAPRLCPECGAYWGCEHQKDDAPPEPAYRYRNRSVMRAFLQRNVEAGTLPAEALKLLMPDEDDDLIL